MQLPRRNGDSTNAAVFYMSLHIHPPSQGIKLIAFSCVQYTSEGTTIPEVIWHRAVHHFFFVGCRLVVDPRVKQAFHIILVHEYQGGIEGLQA